jgi:hypothetical protein
MASAKLDFQITGAEKLLTLQNWCNPQTIAKATRGGITYAAKAAQVAVAKEVRSNYNISSARVKQDVTGPRFSQGGQVATIALSKKPPSALQYGGKDTGKGLTMKVFRGGRHERIEGGFIAKTGRLAGKPFRRTGKPRGQSGALAFVSGPSIGNIFDGKSKFGPAMRTAVNARINEQFIKGMERALKSAARGYGGK